jgi:AmpD protein
VLFPLDVWHLAAATRLLREHVAGHEHVAPRRKADPGAGFDWARLASRLGWSAAMFPPAG